jgi:hypothetical protein
MVGRDCLERYGERSLQPKTKTPQTEFSDLRRLVS